MEADEKRRFKKATESGTISSQELGCKGGEGAAERVKTVRLSFLRAVLVLPVILASFLVKAP